MLGCLGSRLSYKDEAMSLDEVRHQKEENLSPKIPKS